MHCNGPLTQVKSGNADIAILTQKNAIHVGDIVEAQILFEGIRLKGNRSRMAIKLRAITVLDKRVREVSNTRSPKGNRN